MDLIEQRQHGGWTAHMLGQRACGGRPGCIVAQRRLDDRDIGTRQAIEGAGEFIETVHANGFEIITERGFDGAFPASVNIQRLTYAWPSPETRRLPPLRERTGRAAIVATERRLLQRLHGQHFGAQPFAFATRRFETLIGGKLLRAHRLRVTECRGERQR